MKLVLAPTDALSINFAIASFTVHCSYAENNGTMLDFKRLIIQPLSSSTLLAGIASKTLDIAELIVYNKSSKASFSIAINNIVLFNVELESGEHWTLGKGIFAGNGAQKLVSAQPSNGRILAADYCTSNSLPAGWVQSSIQSYGRHKFALADNAFIETAAYSSQEPLTMEASLAFTGLSSGDCYIQLAGNYTIALTTAGNLELRSGTNVLKTISCGFDIKPYACKVIISIFEGQLSASVMPLLAGPRASIGGFSIVQDSYAQQNTSFKLILPQSARVMSIVIS